MIIQYFRNWSRTYNAWVTIIDDKAEPNPGPHHCSPTCIVLDSETLALDYRFDYYMYGQFMKFIPRDAVRIDSTMNAEGMANVAFKTPDGSIVVVAANTQKTDQPLVLAWQGKRLAAKLPARSVATFKWAL